MYNQSKREKLNNEYNELVQKEKEARELGIGGEVLAYIW